MESDAAFLERMSHLLGAENGPRMREVAARLRLVEERESRVDKEPATPIPYRNAR